jgi:hypothetical protein
MIIYILLIDKIKNNQKITHKAKLKTLLVLNKSIRTKLSYYLVLIDFKS